MSSNDSLIPLKFVFQSFLLKPFLFAKGLGVRIVRVSISQLVLITQKQNTKKTYKIPEVPPQIKWF